MRLLDLDPEFVHDATPVSYRRTDDFSIAQGLLFACPYCFRKNGGLIGTHMVLVYFRDKGVPAACEPLPRWTVSGTGLHDLTLIPSIDLTRNQPSEWHGRITNGEVTGV